MKKNNGESCQTKEKVKTSLAPTELIFDASIPSNDHL